MKNTELSRFTAGSRDKDEPERVGQLIPRLSVGANLVTAMFTTFIVGFMAAATVSAKFQHVRGKYTYSTMNL